MLEKENLKIILLAQTLKNFKSYEVCYDERDNCFRLRLFIKDDTYFIITKNEDDTYTLREYKVYRSSYHPSPQVTYINKYFKKYRGGSGYKNYTCDNITFDSLKEILPKVKCQLSDITVKNPRGSYRYTETNRAGGLF